MARDRERLKKMTFYCFTNDCLRDYILKYFGEYGANYCGNCANCLSKFENVDVTDIAKALVGCVAAGRQRFGGAVIIDTVHGANTAKIRQYHMDENIYYSHLSKVPTHTLRTVLNYLLMQGYLDTTEDEYNVVKLTEKSQGITTGKETIIMKLPKTSDLEQLARKEKKSRKGSISAGSVSHSDSLFERLRALRSVIAREEKVPPYLVFSDKTLEHMCVLKPANKEEMLQVTGVGEYKFEKYGERFLAEMM